MATIADRLPGDAEVIANLERHGGITGYAQELGVSGPGLRHALYRRGLLDFAPRGSAAKPAVTSSDVKGLSSDDPVEWGDVRALIERRGLKPDEWVITRARVNEWAEHRQLRVDLAPRSDVLAPARTDGWRPPRVPRRKPGRDGELVAFFGDHHAPHHDEDLHVAVCAWLREHKPHRAVLLGDLLDLDQVSRHRHEPSWTASVQDTIDAGYRILRGYIEASPGTRWQMLIGNHEARIRNAVLEHLRGLQGVCRADSTDPVLGVAHLLRLDELGVEHVCPTGGYEHEQVTVTENLAARHGWIARKGAGASARATIEHLRYSTVIGHTHRQSIIHHTAHSIDGEPRTLLGCEAGTLAKIKGGLGYAISPDWQQGFATASVYPDGAFKLDLATYVDGSLMWRGWRCQP